MQSIYSALHGLLNLILRPGFLLSPGLSLESLVPSFPLALSLGLSLFSLPSPWGQSQAHVVLREGLRHRTSFTYKAQGWSRTGTATRFMGVYASINWLYFINNYSYIYVGI